MGNDYAAFWTSDTSTVASARITINGSGLWSDAIASSTPLETKEEGPLEWLDRRVDEIRAAL